MTSKLLRKKNLIILLFEAPEVFYEAITWKPYLACAEPVHGVMITILSSIGLCIFSKVIRFLLLQAT